MDARRGGSWPWLLLVTAAFLLAFAWRRGRSTVLAIEAERPAALALATGHGLPIAEVFALRELIGASAPAAAWAAAVAEFARRRTELGPELAAVAVAGPAEPAEAARAAAADPAGAWARFRVEPAALPGLRFVQLRERFAARAAARD
jgi:hypothetical protein